MTPTPAEFARMWIGDGYAEDRPVVTVRRRVALADLFERAVGEAVAGPATCLACGKAAFIRCIALDAPPTATVDDRTLTLCSRHYWDWTEKSLRRRGLLAVADELRDQVERGFFDEAPANAWPPRSMPEAIPRRFFD